MLTDTCIKGPHVLWRTRQMANAAVGNHDMVLYDGATRGGVGLVKLVAKVGGTYEYLPTRTPLRPPRRRLLCACITCGIGVLHGVRNVRGWPFII